MIANVITKFRFNEKRPMAELDGIDTFTGGPRTSPAWSASSRRRVLAGGAVEPFELPYREGGDWRGLRGVVSAYV